MNTQTLKILNLESNKILEQILDVIIETGGIIYGGAVRDLIRNKSPRDIDVFYSPSSKVGHPLDMEFFLTALNTKFPTFVNAWMDAPLDDYGQTYEETTVEIWREELGWIDREHDYQIHLVSGKKEEIPTQDQKFLDFDINSLYIDRDGSIKCAIKNECPSRIIKRIQNGKCKSMRNNISIRRLHRVLKMNFCED